MPIRLTTLGGLRAAGDDGELDWLLSQRSRAALLVYLAVEGRVSRDAVCAVFWPESDAENARHALRQSLYQLRTALGAGWLESRAHELRVTAEVRTDALALAAALERGDAEAAARLYEGPFLDGVHLADTQPWESWVDVRRAQYARGFRKACRDWLEARREAGDLPGAVEAAQRWVAPDPFDDEAQHRLIEALADAGERAEAIRQYETYARLLEPEGLRPLEETTGLIERVRSGSAELPPIRPAASARQEAAGRPDAPAQREPHAAVESAAERVPRHAGIFRRPLALLPVALALLLVLAAVWGVGQRQSEPAPALSPTAVAVLPFSVRGAEEAQYLGEGMVNLLGTALDGAATVRPVDTRAVLGALAQDGGAAADPERGGHVAARLGAGMFVLGDVVQSGDRLHIEAALYDGETTAEPRARAAVSGGADALFELVDRLAARLLSGLGDPAADRLLRTAAVTTASLPAFKAYLEGETLMRAGRFERAAEAYLQALAHDSTFAVAYYRLALARDWAGLPGLEEVAGAAVRHGERLSPRDRALLEALQAYHKGDAPGAERRYLAILARYPDDLDARFQLGEALFHFGPMRGRSAAESEDAWHAVLSREPRNPWALVHLARVAAAGARLATLDSLVARFTPDEIAGDRRLVQMGVFRAVAARDTATASTLVRGVHLWEESAVWQFAAYLAAFTHEPPGARRVIRDLLGSARGRSIDAELHWFLALLHLASGQPAAARAARADAVAARAGVPLEPHRRAFDAVTEWWVATLPLPYADSTLERVRRTAASVDASELAVDGAAAPDLPLQIWLQTLPDRSTLEAVRQYTVGVLSLRLGDAGSAAAAARELSGLAGSDVADSFIRDLDRGLRARIAAHEGRPEYGLRLLEGLELGPISLAATNIVPFVARANERYLRGELLVDLDRDAEALPWFASLGEHSVPESPFRAPAHLRQAEIHDRLGNWSEAAEHYARYVELWRDGDPELQPLVDAARERLAELTRMDEP